MNRRLEQGPILLTTIGKIGPFFHIAVDNAQCLARLSSQLRSQLAEENRNEILVCIVPSARRRPRIRL